MTHGALDLERQRDPQTAAPPMLPDRDVRRKRPPALSFLLRLATLRTTLRILSLLALDFAGVWLSLFVGAAAEGAAQERPRPLRRPALRLRPDA